MRLAAGLAATALAACGPAHPAPASRTSVSAASRSQPASRAPRNTHATHSKRNPAQPASATATLRSGVANPAFVQTLPLLQRTTATVWLPVWLPPPASGRHDYFTVRTTATTYRIGLYQVSHAAPPGSLPPPPQKDDIGAIAGGSASALGASPAVPTPTAGGTPAAPEGGAHTTYYPQTAKRPFSLLQWQAQGWTFQVADVSGVGRPAAALEPYARRLAALVPSGKTPVPRIPRGTVVQTITPAGASTWVLWRRGPWTYRVRGAGAQALRLAASMTRVSARRR